MLNNPIIIAAPPRSGTTMVAGLLKLHGFWVGRSRITNHPESNSLIATENQDIKNLMKIMARSFNYQNWNSDLPKTTPKDAEIWGCWLRSEIKKIVPEDTIWLIKTSWTLIFYDIWKTAFPNAKWIIVDRRTTNICNSIKHHPKMRRHINPKIFIKKLHNIQSRIWEELGVKQVLLVSAEALVFEGVDIAGNLLTFCGSTLNPNIVKAFIKPEKWHEVSHRLAGIPMPTEGGKRFNWLKRMIKERGYTNGAEIGCARGRTTSYLLKKCPTLSLICVDLWGPAPKGNGGTQYKKWDFDNIYKGFLRSVASHNGRVRIIQSLSWEAASLIEDESLDFVFIDADHEYDSVKKDILAWAPKVKTGGTVCGHDTHFSGVMKAIKELIPNHKLVGIDHMWECRKEDVRV